MNLYERKAAEKSLQAKYQKNKADLFAEGQARDANRDEELCRGQDVLFLQGYEAAKKHYGEVGQIRLAFLLEERFHVDLKAGKLREAENKIKDLVNECEFYSKCMQEVESHYLTRWVRFLQSFHSRCWWKLRDVTYAGKYFIKAFLPRKEGYEPEHRSELYETLQAHLKDKQSGKGKDL